MVRNKKALWEKLSQWARLVRFHSALTVTRWETKPPAYPKEPCHWLECRCIVGALWLFPLPSGNSHTWTSVATTSEMWQQSATFYGTAQFSGSLTTPISWWPKDKLVNYGKGSLLTPVLTVQVGFPLCGTPFLLKDSFSYILLCFLVTKSCCQERIVTLHSFAWRWISDVNYEMRFEA